jgi:hypothetical protein
VSKFPYEILIDLCVVYQALLTDLTITTSLNATSHMRTPFHLGLPHVKFEGHRSANINLSMMRILGLLFLSRRK